MDLESLIKKSEELIGLKCKVENADQNAYGKHTKFCKFITNSGHVAKVILLRSYDGYDYFIGQVFYYSRENDSFDLFYKQVNLEAMNSRKNSRKY